jgi:hypothetical protein
MTSYGSSQIWAAKSGWGRKAGNGFMIGIKMSGEHTERKVVAHAKIDSAETPKLLNSSKKSGYRLL